MDSSELRFLILTLGVLFVAALYLWERHKSTHAQHNRRKKVQNMIENHDHRDDDHDSEDVEERPGVRVFRNRKHPAYSAKREQADTAENQSESSEEAIIEHPAHKEEILCLSVASKRKFFTGDAIVSAMIAADLSPGPMDIYYRYDGSEELFAVASMVEPGTFPQDMSRFRSSGLSLFARLPGRVEGMEVFDEMHEAALMLAEKLDGIVLGNDHKPLVEETLEKMRALAATMPALRRRRIKVDAE